MEKLLPTVDLQKPYKQEEDQNFPNNQVDKILKTQLINEELHIKQKKQKVRYIERERERPLVQGGAKMGVDLCRNLLK